MYLVVFVAAFGLGGVREPKGGINQGVLFLFFFPVYVPYVY